MGLQSAIIAVLTGMALGLRYKVFVLVPAVTLTMMFAAIAGIAHGDQLASITWAMALLVATVQFGYVTGVAIHAAAGPIWASLIGGRNPQLNSQLRS